MKDLAALAAKYDTGRKYGCLVCDLKPDHLVIVRALRKDHRMSIRGLVGVIGGEFGVALAETTVQKHFAKHEGKA
jgi:hypothetical protein